MTNSLKRSLAFVLMMAMLMGVMILTGAASAKAEGSGAAPLNIGAAAAVPQEDAQDTALYDIGDVDNSKKVDASDALVVLQITVDLRNPTRPEADAGDVNGDGLLDTKDALQILQRTVELIDRFEVQVPDPSTPDDVDLTETLAEYTGKEYYFDNFKTAKKLYVFGAAGSNPTVPERFCALALQGLVAAQGDSQIFISYDLPSYNQWLSELEDQGIELVYVNDLWDLVDQFKSYIKDSHYVTYTYFNESQPETGNIGDLCSYANASTIAGQEHWLPIDSKLEAEAQEAGLTVGTGKEAMSSISGKNETLGNAALFEEYDLADYYGFGEGKLDTQIMIMLGARDYNMRDVGIAKGCFHFTNNKGRTLSPILSKMDDNAVIMGWVDSDGTSERINLDNPLIAELNQLGAVIVPTDHANNISVYSGLAKSNFKQTPATSNARTDNDVHYATLIMEGGTNYSLVERGFVQTQAHLPFDYWNNSARGTIPMGWTLTPMMTDMSPLILNYLYQTATVNDQFVASLSGLGYHYSDILDMENLEKRDAVLTEHYKRTAEYMQGANMEYITIMQNAPVTDETMLEKQLGFYSEPAGIKGGILYSLNGTGYVTGTAGLAGAVYWSNNKPFVNLRDCLSYPVDTSLAYYQRDGIDVKSQGERNKMLQELAWRLNNRTKDATTIDGYSAINVYHWAFSYNDCVTLSKMLDDDVVLVAPGEFLQLIQKNVSKQNASVSSEPAFGDEDQLPALPGESLPEKQTALGMAASTETTFDFRNSTMGWSLVGCGGTKDNAYLTEAADGKLQINLAGDKSDDEEAAPNAMIYNKIAVPAGAKSFEITTASASSADVRLIAVDDKGNETVIMGTKTEKDENDEDVVVEVEWGRLPSKRDSKYALDISKVSGKNIVFYLQFRGNSTRITQIDII